MKKFFSYSARILLFVGVVSFVVRHLLFSGEMFIFEVLGTVGFLFGFFSLAIINFYKLKEGTLLQRRQRLVGIFIILGIASLNLCLGLRFLQIDIAFLILPMFVIGILLIIFVLAYIAIDIIRILRKE